MVQIAKLESHHVWVDGVRCYAIDGAVRPGVTSVLSAGPEPEWLAKWRADKGPEEAERIRMTAANRGTLLHHKIEAFFGETRGEEPTFEDHAPDPALVQRMFEMVTPVLERITPIAIEAPVQWSCNDPVIGNGFAGTVDMLATITPPAGGAPVPVVMDWKSSTRPIRQQLQLDAKVRNYLLQLAAYRAALRQCYPEQLADLKTAMAVVIPQSGKLQAFEFNEHDLLGAEVEFVGLLRRYYATRDNGPTIQAGLK